MMSVVASNAEAAMGQVATHKPRIVFTDLKMTPKSGFQLAEDISNSLGIKNVDIIAIDGVLYCKRVRFTHENLWN